MLKSQTSQIIFTIILLFLSSVIFLLWTENVQHNYSNNKSWWAISLAEPNPSSDNLNFEIENYTSNNKFTYIIKNKDIILLEKNIEIPKDSKKSIFLDFKSKNENILIEIVHENNIKTLYK